MNKPLLSLVVVLTAASLAGRAQAPVQDAGVAGVWQKLGKLQTTASVMHTTAHPDDEHGGVLTWLSRGQGARVSLMTLTRGESGDNAIGSELFDALGLVRTEELALADRYYGVDQQYYGTVVDYGFSKRLDETLEKWGRERALADLVRVIRIERPLVIVSRFQGNARDGHGNHSAAGLLSREAFAKAGDPAAFPDQIAGGLRPWQPLKLYMGGVREQEDWTLRVDAGAYDPVQGESYAALARLGLGFQRSQNGGRVGSQPGPAFWYYKRLESKVSAPDREQSFFDGIDTTIPGVYRTLQRDAPDGAAALLSAIDREIGGAVRAFTLTNPSASAPSLARALVATREAARALGRDRRRRAPAVDQGAPDRRRHARRARGAARGHSAAGRGGRSIRAVQPAAVDAAGRSRADLHRPHDVCRARTGGGQSHRRRDHRCGRAVEDRAGPVASCRRSCGRGAVHGYRSGRRTGDAAVLFPRLDPGHRLYDGRRGVRELSRPRARRSTRAQPTRSTACRSKSAGQSPASNRTCPTASRFLRWPSCRRLSVALTPAHAVVPLSGSGELTMTVDLSNNREASSKGSVRLALPEGWTATPSTQAFEFSRAGERALYSFKVRAPAERTGTHRIEAVASLDGREYRDGFQVIRHRDLETRRLYRDAVASVRGVDVRVAPGLRVGYVMGIGDDVPAGIAQLGAAVQLLDERDLASGDLARFHAIVTGTRAYAVRADLRTYNRRLLDYVRDGGHLIVLYNTQELVPNLFAPYPGELPASAEEVSEEDSPADILAPGLPVLTAPNRITAADFEGWVEQRGSKFWAPGIRATPRSLPRGTAARRPSAAAGSRRRYGKGQYTYFAYALHRQLPYGVPGAYRLLANLLSLAAR